MQQMLPMSGFDPRSLELKVRSHLGLTTLVVFPLKFPNEICDSSSLCFDSGGSCGDGAAFVAFEAELVAARNCAQIPYYSSSP